MERLALWAADFKSDPSLRNITRLYRQMSAMNDVNPVLQLRVQIAGQPSTLVVNQVMTIEKRVGIIFQDIDLANTVAQMLNQAIAFANPEMEAVEENMLIKEFHTNAMRISQKLQVFISEVSAWENPNEACLCALLASNQDIMQALRSYDQIMEQCAIRTAIKLNHAVNECRAASDQGASTSLPLSPLKDDDKGDLELTLSAAGVGSVYTSLQSTVPQEKSTESAYQAAREEVSVPEPVDPFADDAYRITGAADIAAAIRSGKRKESAQKDDVVSQEEMDLIKMVEKHSLHSFPEQAGSSSGSSSSLLRSTSSSTPALIAQSIPIAAVPPVV
ncbi:hypothetical protein EDD11_004069 [Mortierella claussenii]|nr:hypothetical protein EDD11_004069 [Mortierella claussenii]